MAERPEKSRPPGSYASYQEEMRDMRAAEEKGDTKEAAAAGQRARKIERKYEDEIKHKTQLKDVEQAVRPYVLNKSTQQKTDWQAEQEAYRNSPEGKAQAEAQAARAAERAARPIEVWGKGSIEEQLAWKRAQGRTLWQMQGLLAEL
jgi:hypothetical protein